MKRLRKYRLIRLEEDDDDFFEEDENGPVDSGSLDSDITGTSIAPMFTGLLGPSGTPIIRHPVLTRMGFHPESRKYHTPTMDEQYPGEGAVVGWLYEI